MPAIKSEGLHTTAAGRLKVFLGYASGVGKSWRMFDEARRRQERGQDIVVAALQPAVSDSVQPLFAGLEIVPALIVDGVPVINVPAILNRHPRVCMVDGSPWTTRHPVTIRIDGRTSNNFSLRE